MPRKQTSKTPKEPKEGPKEIYKPLDFTNRISRRIQNGCGLLEAEGLEGIGYDKACDEAVNKAAETLLALIDEQISKDAILALGQEIWNAGFCDYDLTGPDAGKRKQKRTGLLLESPEGRRKFPALARRLDVQKKMGGLRSILECAEFTAGTPVALKAAICFAFEAGAAFAEAAKTGTGQGSGNSKAHQDALYVLFEKASASIRGRLTPKQVWAKCDDNELNKVIEEFGKLEDTTMLRKIGEWIKGRG